MPSPPAPRWVTLCLLPRRTCDSGQHPLPPGPGCSWLPSSVSTETEALGCTVQSPSLPQAQACCPFPMALTPSWTSSSCPARGGPLSPHGRFPICKVEMTAPTYCEAEMWRGSLLHRQGHCPRGRHVDSQAAWLPPAGCPWCCHQCTEQRGRCLCAGLPGHACVWSESAWGCGPRRLPVHSLNGS